MGWCWFSFSVLSLREPTHVRAVFRPPSWRPSDFLLLVQKKVTKEKTPSRPRFAGHPCPANCASRLRGSLRGHPCPLRERACLRARARVRSTRLILRLLAAAERGPG